MPLILPTGERRACLRLICTLLLEYKNDGDGNSLSGAVAMMLKEHDFAAAVAKNDALNKTVDGPDQLMKIAWAYLYVLLSRRDFVAAAMILWDQETFTPEPHCVQLMWEALFTKRMIGVMGGGGMGKTYSASAFFLLEWITDPEWTRFQVASASEDHLKKNLYADIVRLHQGASINLPGEPDTEAISLNKKTGMGIFTLILPGGPLSKGKIKGAHTKPRPYHPLFKRRSRVFTLIDEAQEVPQNIFGEIPNRFSTVVAGDVDHLKFVITANPKDQYSQFGQACKPACGFDNLPLEVETWESDTGWAVVSLNAMRHENVVQRKIVFPGFVTYDGVQVWLRKCHGDANDPEMWTYVYGRFPPQGITHSVIKSAWINRSEGEWVFDTIPFNVAAVDPGFTGDLATMAIGRVGRAVMWRSYDGWEHRLKTPAMKIQVDVVAILPRGDTQELANEVMSRLKLFNVEPPYFAIDKTGVGLGVHDVIRRQWKEKVNALGMDDAGLAPICGLHYAQEPSQIKVADEDTETPKDIYDRMASELWFAGAKLFEYDVIRVGRGVDRQTFSELSSRQGGMLLGRSKKLGVESKDAYKVRTGSNSPDRADCVLMLLHAGRTTTPGLIPKAQDTLPAPAEKPLIGWSGFSQAFQGADIEGFGTGQELADMRKD